MKFSNEEAFEKLKGMLTNEGKKPLRMSEVSLKKQIETLLPLLSSEETELEEFAQKVITSLEVMNSNAEYDNSSNYKKLKEQFEKEFGERNINPKPNENEPKPDDEKFAALMQKMEALETKLANAEKEKNLGNIRNQIVEGLIGKGIKNKEWIDVFLSEIAISEETDVNAKVESIVKLYNKTRANGVDYDNTPDNSGSPSGVEDRRYNDFLNDFKKEREAEIEKSKQMI